MNKLQHNSMPRLAPALEVLYAAVAVAGDQTAKVSLVAGADLFQAIRWVGCLAFSSFFTRGSRFRSCGLGSKIPESGCEAPG